jgi:alpha-mannosidase
MSTDIDINEIMNRWRTGVKRKQRGLATFAERTEMRMAVLADRMYPKRLRLDDWKIREVRCTAVGRYEPLDRRWRPMRLGDTWGAEGTSAFWRRRIVIPREFAGARVLLRLYIGGDALLTVNGKPFHGLDPFHHEVQLAARARGGEVLAVGLESYVAWHAEKRFPHPFALAELVAVDDEVRRVFFDFRAAVKALDIVDIDRKLEHFLSTRLWEALKLVPLQEPDPAAMRRAILAAGDQLRRDVYETGRFRGHGLMHLVGHSHLDLVFMWPYREFVRKIGRTHSTMLRLLEQYPEFAFCQSQAKLYADMKAYFPDLYRQVKKRVAEGRWELIGAFWVEPDCNLISGESFVRQILYGQKFFQEEFGRRLDTCWQPDVFGLSWAMPQVMARSGIRYFLTNKMAIWNDTNPWTMHTFWWEGMDGSRVLSIVPPGHFIGTVEPDILDRQWRTFSDKETIGQTLHVYGWGDGGGGPDPEMIECGRRYADFPGLVKTRFSTAHAAFESIAAKAAATDKLPVLRDEIYLEAHRGTYTNKARLKKLNRRMEFLYREAELAASLAHLAGRRYPAEALLAGWQDLLTTQFHDSLPGTHITEAYHELLDDYRRIQAVGEKVREDGLAAVLGKQQARGRTLLVFNSLLHARAGILSAPAAMLGGQAVADPEAGPLPQQRVTDLDGAEKVLVRVPEVPPVGYRAFDLVLRGRAPCGEACLPAGRPSVRATPSTLENEFLKARLNRDGELVSLYDKVAKREVIEAGQAGNRFQLYEDTPGQYEAWDIAATYVDHEVALSGGGRLRVDEEGPVRASLLLERPIAASRLRQRISLAAGSRLLEFETEIAWVERQRLLKVNFPVAVRSLVATYDIAYGNMTRPTHRNTPFDAAKFEVPAHLWMDLSQADYGVSLLNDCKYGHECKGNVMRLTLLKGATRPDPEADKETHHFTYALYPHAGAWREARTNAAALAMNVPMLARRVAAPPAGGTSHSFLACDAPGVALEAVKRAEDGPDLIVRLVEREGALARGRVTFDRPVRKAWSCNLMEEKESPLLADGASVKFAARPYEIVTVRAAF